MRIVDVFRTGRHDIMACNHTWKVIFFYCLVAIGHLQQQPVMGLFTILYANVFFSRCVFFQTYSILPSEITVSSPTVLTPLLLNLRTPSTITVNLQAVGIRLQLLK